MRQITYFFLAFSVGSYCLLPGAVHAVSFNVVEIESEEMTFDEPGDTLTPTTLNNVLSFSVEPAGGGAVTQVPTTNFYGLAPDAIDTPFPIQYQGLTERLFPDDASYLSAGTQGLSLSTGINKTTGQNIESLFFPVILIDPLAIGDGAVDFFAADIANNQSPDLWELLDSDGNLVASLVTEGAATGGGDWNRLGTQNLDRWDNATDTLRPGFNNRHLSALAFELADFTGLTALNAAQVASMRITIADPSNTTDNRPRTDYAFFSSDVTSIQFSNQVAPAAVAVPGTAALMLLALLVPLFATRGR